jgi:hypothetical protein
MKFEISELINSDWEQAREANPSGQKKKKKSTSYEVPHYAIFPVSYYFVSLLFKRVGIAQSVWRRATGWTARVRIPTVQDFSLLHSAQTDSGVHPASYPIGTRGYFPGGKAARA